MNRFRNPIQNTVRYLLPAFILAATLGLFAVTYLASPPLQGHVFSSDALYLPTLFTDVLERGGRLADWRLTPAPYVFPDMPMYAVAHMFGENAFVRIGVFALLQILAVFALLAALMKNIGVPHAALTAAAATAGMTVLGLAGSHPFVFLFVSAHHYGIFLAQLALLALWFEASSTSPDWEIRSWVARLAMLALTALTTLSDVLFLAQTVVPLAAMSWFFAARNRQPAWRRVWRDHRALLVVGGVSAILMAVLANVSDTLTAGPAIVVSPFQGLGIFKFIHFEGAQTPALALCGCLWLIMVGLRFWALSRGAFLESIDPLFVFSAFGILSLIVAFTLTSAAPHVRYMIPIFSWPVILSFTLLAHFQVRWHRFALGAAALATIVWGAALTGRLIALNGFSTGYYPNEIACLDAVLEPTEARYGIAQYWDAKPVENFSRVGIRIAQYGSDLRPYHWISSASSFSDRYDFALVNLDQSGAYLIPEARLKEINGPPLQETVCGTQKILVYLPGALNVAAQ